MGMYTVIMYTYVVAQLQYRKVTPLIIIIALQYLQTSINFSFSVSKLLLPNN